MWIAAWIGLSILVGMAGSHRTIGFFWALALSLICSPVIGVIGVALSRRTNDAGSYRNSSNIINEPAAYENLKKLKDSGIISQEDFIRRRNELFDSNR